MPRIKLAIRLESLARPLRQALDLATTLEIPGVQFDAVADLAPDALSQTGRKDIRNRLRALNLELSAIGCPLRRGFDTHEGLEARIAHVKKVLTLAYDLGPRLVIVSAGTIPEKEDDLARPILTDSLTALGNYGDRIGSTLALEAGAEPPGVLKAFINRLNCGGLGVNLDPATLLSRGHDPVAAVREFANLILHTHARDARPGRVDRDTSEMPLGHGDIDWLNYLGALEEVGYRRWMTIKRGLSPDPVTDIKQAVALLRRLGV